MRALMLQTGGDIMMGQIYGELEYDYSSTIPFTYVKYLVQVLWFMIPMQAPASHQLERNTW